MMMRQFGPEGQFEMTRSHGSRSQLDRNQRGLRENSLSELGLPIVEVGFGNAFDGTKGCECLTCGVEVSESFMPTLVSIGHNKHPR